MLGAFFRRSVPRTSLLGTRNAVRLCSTGPPMFDKILVANRGEIACRVMKTARQLGIRTVAVYSDADADSMFVEMADEAYHIGPSPSKESYLKGDTILDVAKKSGAQAIHPGYGFLSENADFARKCEDNGITFIGPPASAIVAMGSKSESKTIMIAADVPCVPGYHGADQSLDTLISEADKIGYPVMLKAVLGGGGKGMRIVHSREDMEDAVAATQREAQSSFGDSVLLIEKYITHPRHIEIQVFADKLGNAVALFERDCSVQRRHQKVLEEAPAPGMDPAWRKYMCEAAVRAAKAVGYVGAGTVEFIVDEDKNFYFMEMNTRLQVEHPVTEMITKQDLVHWQLLAAAGSRLPLLQDDLKIHGHAIEARIYAEDPNNNFLPMTGHLYHLRTPKLTDNVRVDTGVREGDDISIYYDPMISKLIVWDQDRTSALRRMRQALREYEVVGPTTNIAFILKCLENPAYIDASGLETGFIEKYQDSLIPPPAVPDDKSLALAAVSWALTDEGPADDNTSDVHSPWAMQNDLRLNGAPPLHSVLLGYPGCANGVPVTFTRRDYSDFNVTLPSGNSLEVSASVEDNGVDMAGTIDGARFRVAVVPRLEDGHLTLFSQDHRIDFTLPLPSFLADKASADDGSLKSPMPGKVIKVLVKPGQEVKANAPLMIMEAMKMEHTIRAPFDGVVARVNYSADQLVDKDKLLVKMATDKDEE